MVNEKKYQVFISSTYEDLKVHRDYAMKAVLELGHIPIGMELFSASDETQWELIKRRIEESDYYILIIAHRYGSLDGEISYTQKEFEYAVEIGVPVMSFIIDKSIKNWNNDYCDSGKKKTKLDKFKKLASDKKVVNYWVNEFDLNSKIKSSLQNAIIIKPRKGWVRADETDYKNVASELARLVKENEELKDKISLVSSNDTINENLISQLRKLKKKIELNWVLSYYNDYSIVSCKTTLITYYEVFLRASSEFKLGIPKNLHPVIYQIANVKFTNEIEKYQDEEHVHLDCVDLYTIMKDMSALELFIEQEYPKFILTQKGYDLKNYIRRKKLLNTISDSKLKP